MEKHILYGATVICEKQPVDNPWIEHRWVINDLLPKKWVKGDGVAPAGYVPLLPLHVEKDNEESNNLYIADVLIDARVGFACLCFEKSGLSAGSHVLHTVLERLRSQRQTKLHRGDTWESFWRGMPLGEGGVIVSGARANLRKSFLQGVRQLSEIFWQRLKSVPDGLSFVQCPRSLPSMLVLMWEMGERLSPIFGEACPGY